MPLNHRFDLIFVAFVSVLTMASDREPARIVALEY